MDETTQEAAPGEPITRPNLGANPSLDAEIAGLDSIPGIVHGFEDKIIELNGQQVLVHESSNFPYTLSLVRKYKKALEEDDSSSAIAELESSLDPFRKIKLSDVT